MKNNLIIELEGTPREGDLIAFISGKWQIVLKEKYLDEMKVLINDTNTRIDSVLETLKNVDTKLQEHHNALKVLLEED